MPRANHYSKAKLLWNNVAYCDQWEKVMAVYDEFENLRAVVKEIDDEEYTVLLIGEDTQILYVVYGIELGSTGKNMKACFGIYCRLQYEDTPSYVPSYCRTEGINLYQIFTHTKVGARRTGGFHVTDDSAGEKIAKALERYEEIVSGDIGTIDCFDWNEYEHYSERYPDTIYGLTGTMYHVGDGAYCDDDGDNWEFL